MEQEAPPEPPPPPAAQAYAGPPIVLDEEPAIDRNLVHKNVIEIFPDLDLTETIQDYGHMTPEGLASLIIDQMAQIPKKRGTKRKATDFVDNHPAESTLEYSDTASENSEDLGDLLIEKFLATLIHKIKSELRQLDKSAGGARADLNKRNFLMNQFTGVRLNFIDNMLHLFNHSLVPTSIACFIAENNFSSKLQKLAPGLSQNFWLKSGPPMQNKRKPHMHRIPADIWNEFEDYTQLMRSYQEGEYASLLTADLKLTHQYNLIRWERTEPEEKIECLVCYDKFLLRRITYCSAPTVPQHAFFADQSTLVEKNKSEPKMDKPGTSNAVISDEDSTADLNGQPEWSIIDVGEEGNKDPSTHPFCRDCIRGQAQAATEQQPLAEGGVGLCCMVPNCKNPILYSDIRPILSKEICMKLDERMMQENVAMALLSNLERCKRCNYAVEMEVDKTVDKVFHCLQCDTKFCRICGNDWDDDHFGISCEEVEQKLQRDRKDRILEKQLNEAVIRKCPRCGVAFMKDQGCNKMTCRCGMTSCYICRAEKIDYTHFCQHIRDPSNPNWKCTECKKTCLLYEDAVKKDELLIAKIRKEAADVVNNPQEEPNTSNATAPAGPNPPPIGNQQQAINPRRGRRWNQLIQQANVNNAYQMPAVYIAPAGPQLPMEVPYLAQPAYEHIIQARNVFENIRQRQQQDNQQANQYRNAYDRHFHQRPFVPPRNGNLPFLHHPPYAQPGNGNPVPLRNYYQGIAQLRDLREHFMIPQRYDVPPPPIPPHRQNYVYPEAPPPPLPPPNQQHDYVYPELPDNIPLPPMPNNNNQREFAQQQAQQQIGLNAILHQRELELFDQYLAEAFNEVQHAAEGAALNPHPANGNNHQNQ